jgi:hypothetical protein
MLPEQRATSYSNDPATSTVIIVADPPRGLHGDLPARLLLDTASHVVGVDVAPDSPQRLVVMLGPHEKVARTEDVRALVDGGTVRLQGHAAKLVAPGANPYVF